MPADPRLQQRLAAIARTAAAQGADPGQAEAEFLALLERFDADEERGRIHAAIASMYANSGMRQPGKVAEYARRALAHPLDVLEACRMYVYWSDAFLAAPAVAGMERGDARRESTIACLRGLRLVMDHSGGPSETGVPPLFKFDYDGPLDARDHQQLLKEHDHARSRREHADLHDALEHYRVVFTARCADLHAQEPHALDELNRLAGEILEDEAATAYLVGQARMRIEGRDAAQGELE